MSWRPGRRRHPYVPSSPGHSCCSEESVVQTFPRTHATHKFAGLLPICTKIGSRQDAYQLMQRIRPPKGPALTHIQATNNIF